MHPQTPPTHLRPPHPHQHLVQHRLRLALPHVPVLLDHQQRLLFSVRPHLANPAHLRLGHLHQPPVAPLEVLQLHLVSLRAVSLHSLRSQVFLAPLHPHPLPLHLEAPHRKPPHLGVPLRLLHLHLLSGSRLCLVNSSPIHLLNLHLHLVSPNPPQHLLSANHNNLRRLHLANLSHLHPQRSVNLRNPRPRRLASHPLSDSHSNQLKHRRLVSLHRRRLLLLVSHQRLASFVQLFRQHSVLLSQQPNQPLANLNLLQLLRSASRSRPSVRGNRRLASPKIRSSLAPMRHRKQSIRWDLEEKTRMPFSSLRTTKVNSRQRQSLLSRRMSSSGGIYPMSSLLLSIDSISDTLGQPRTRTKLSPRIDPA